MYLYLTRKANSMQHDGWEGNPRGHEWLVIYLSCWSVVLRDCLTVYSPVWDKNQLTCHAWTYSSYFFLPSVFGLRIASPAFNAPLAFISNVTPTAQSMDTTAGLRYESMVLPTQVLFTLKAINQMEREMGSYLNWELNVDSNTIVRFESNAL